MSANVNKNLDLLAAQWGTPKIDNFGTFWRLWFDDYHQHYGTAMHGSFTADGKTLEEAIMRAFLSAKKHPPQKKFHCRKGCPHYSDDIY